MMPTPAVQADTGAKPRFIRILGWCALAAFGGAAIYLVFARLTRLEPSLIGIPVGLAVGQFTYYASAKRGGRWFQALAVILAFLAFDLTYDPGMAGVSLKGGVTLVKLAFFVFITVVSPVIDSHNGFLGQFMVAGGMYMSWTLARARKAAT